MKKLLLFLQFIIVFQTVFSQDVCDKKKQTNNINDISSITKCFIVHNADSINGKNNKSEVTMVSVRNHQKRHLSTNRENEATVYKTITKDSIKLLNLKYIKEKVSTINTALKEKIFNEQISFDKVETVPQFKDCSNSTLDIFDCFNYEMQKYLIKNIIYPKKALKNKIEGDVWVSFVINSYGKVNNISAIGPENSKMLEKEAIRVISLLPTFIPGKNNNKNVNVSFSFPISFSLNNMYK